MSQHTTIIRDRAVSAADEGAELLVLGMGYRPCALDPETVAMSAKYLEVLAEFGARWPGECRYLLETGDVRSLDMDVEIAVADLPVEAVPFDRTAISSADFPTEAMVLMPLETGIPRLHEYVDNSDLRLIRGSDVSPAVSRSIIMLTQDRGPKAKLGGLVYVEREKRRQIRAVRAAAGIQSNQFATYDYFAKWARDRMAFIDTRIRKGEAADASDMAKRRERYVSGEPLHLCFFGRLDPVKSALDIADIARSLRDQGIPFRYSVFGDGPLKDPLEQKIDEYGLSDEFAFHGFVDLRATYPLLKAQVDVFVGNHHQGDTSTAYPEMMAAGIPVVSYPNPAVQALKRYCGVTTHAARIEPAALAAAVASLHRDRSRLWSYAERDHAWGQHQTLGAAYQARIDHVLEHRERFRSAMRTSR